MTATAAAAITSSVIASVTIAGISSAAGLLGFGPKAPPAQSTVSTVKTPIPPRTYGYGRRRLYGSKILFETNSEGATVDVYAYADGEADGVEQVYLNDDKVTIVGGNVQTLPDNRYQSNHVKAGFSLGATPGTAFAEVIARLPGIWTANHRGDGVVAGYLVKLPEKSRSFLTTYPQGDNVELSAVFRLGKCFDPRTGLTAWTENPVLHLMDYLVNKRGYDYATRFVPTLQYWIDAANVCDEAVPLKAGGSEPRYRSCVTYDATRPPKEIVGAILETFDGWIAPRGDGAFVVYAGKLYVPTVTLGPDEIINYNLPYGVANENRLDQLTVSYVSAEHDYNVVDTTPWGPGGLKAEGFGPQTPSYSQNRRLAKRAFARANEFNRGSIVTNLGGRKARGHRYINLLIEESGIVFFEGLAEITAVKRDFTAGGLAIEWIAVDENIDGWNPATEEGEPAALGDRVAPQPVEVPMINAAYAVIEPNGASATIYIETDGNRGDAVTWYSRTRRVGDTAWNEVTHSDIVDAATITLQTNLVPINDSIEVSIAYSNGSGQFSDWSATQTVSTSTADIAPQPVTELSATGGEGFADVSWRNSITFTFDRARLSRSTTSDFDDAVLVAEYSGAPSAFITVRDDSLSADDYWYFVEALNAGGIASAPVSTGPVTVTAAP